LIVTHLIPFRILLPIGIIQFDKGTISVVGSAKFQQITLKEPSSKLNFLVLARLLPLYHLAISQIVSILYRDSLFLHHYKTMF